MPNQNTFMQIASQEDSARQVHEIKRQARNSYIALACFVIVISIVIVIRQFSHGTQFELGKTYQEQIMSLEIDSFRYMNDNQLQEEQHAKTKSITTSSNTHNITRQQLGRHSWSLLHMITGTFPQDLSRIDVMKFNTFLTLFAQFYPCKMCANHFLALLRQQGLFYGSTKNQLMEYMCKLHNKVSKRIGKQQHSCKNVMEQWNTCGCSG